MYGESSTDGERLLRRHVDRDGHDVGLRHHHVGDVLVAEVEDLVDQLPLALLDLALLGGAGDEHPQLGLGVHLALGARRLEAEASGGSTSVDVCSSQMTGRKTMKNPRTGIATQSAVPSAWPSAAPFGTSSPKTTWKKVRIA